MLSGKQEVALARRVGNCYGGIAYYGGIAPLDFRDVSRPRLTSTTKACGSIKRISNEPDGKEEGDEHLSVLLLGACELLDVPARS
jgi:hypothetical protein